MSCSCVCKSVIWHLQFQILSEHDVSRDAQDKSIGLHHMFSGHIYL